MQTETNNKPLYVRLNEKRTKGEWTTTDETYPFPCEWIIKSSGKDIIHVGNINDLTPRIRNKSNAEYAALAVNNLAPLAEALQAFVDYLDSDLSEAETILLEMTKKALASIS